jgi:hypothetical protein
LRDAAKNGASNAVENATGNGRCNPGFEAGGDSRHGR